MMEDEEQTLLTGLDADDWNTARDAVEVAGDWLRAPKINHRLRAEIASRFLRLASHHKWEIRKAIAHAMLFLQHDSFLATIGSLVDDENAWVQEAARKTLRRRENLTRADIGGADQGDAVLGLLSSLEARYGLRARRTASRIADQLHHRFVREAFHEISRIIAPLDASLLNLANELEDAPDISDHLRQSCTRAQRRVQLITEFLDNLRAFTAGEPSAFTREWLRPIVQEAIELAAGQDAGAGVDIELKIDNALKLEASRSHLLQAFINVIINAIEACAGQAHRGMITISAQFQDDTHVKISITDNGCGMSAEAVKDCLLLYSTGKVGGMGFGIPLAKKIVEISHHGTLSIESQNGNGTTVTIMLPVEQLRLED
jgi:signal transduction histidine kinase